MTRLQTSAPARRTRAARVAALAALATIALAEPAMADVPEGWSDPAAVPLLHWVLILLVLPVVSALVIAALAYAFDVVKRGKNPGVHAAGSPEEAMLAEGMATRAISSGH